MTIGEFGYKVAETLLPDPRNPAEVAEFTLDAAMAVKSGGVIPAAKLLTKKTIGKKAIKEILNWDLDKARRLVFGDKTEELVDASTGMTMKIDDVNSAKPLQMTGSGGGIFKGFGQNFVPPNPSEVSNVTKKLLNENVLVGPKRTFDYNAFRALFTGNK